MAARPFVDTHIHFWDLKDPNLRYAWLERDWVHPVLGNIDGLKVLRYMAEEFIGETRFQNVSKIVHAQAGDRHRRPRRGDPLAPGAGRQQRTN